MRLGSRIASTSGKAVDHVERRARARWRWVSAARVEVHLQRADAGRQFQQAREARALQRLHQRLHLEAQRQVEFGRAELDQQVVFAGLPDADRDALRPGRADSSSDRDLRGSCQANRGAGQRRAAKSPATPRSTVLLRAVAGALLSE